MVQLKLKSICNVTQAMAIEFYVHIWNKYTCIPVLDKKSFILCQHSFIKFYLKVELIFIWEFPSNLKFLFYQLLILVKW